MFSQPFISSAASESALALEVAGHAQPWRRSSIVAVWQDTLSTFSAHSAAILFCALIGFAAPSIIGNWLYTSAKLSEYAHTRAVVTLYDKPSLSTLPVQAVVGMLALSFAHGVIASLALHGQHSCEECTARGSFGKACHAALSRYPMLLAGSLFYGALITTGILGMSVLTQSLEFVPTKMAHAWAGPFLAFGDVLHQLAWRSFNVLIPDPGPPFAVFIPDLRQDIVLARLKENLLFAGIPDHNTYAYGLDYLVIVGPARSTSFRLLAFGSIALILLAETLLRFRTVMALQPFGPQRPEGLGLLAPLIDSARFGLRHFVAITVHVWIVRLAIFALSVAFIEFPLAAMDHFVMPNAIRLAGHFEMLLVMKFLASAGAAIVSAILLAFSTVYDARLVRQLTPLQSAHAFNVDANACAADHPMPAERLRPADRQV